MAKNKSKSKSKNKSKTKSFSWSPIPLLSSILNNSNTTNELIKPKQHIDDDDEEAYSLPLYAMHGKILDVMGLADPGNFDKNLQSRMQNMSNLAKDTTVSAILDMYADDATSQNAYGRILWAESEDDEIRERTDRFINDNLLEDLAWEHIRSLATYGRLFIPSDDAFASEKTAAEGLKVRLDNNKIKTAFEWYPRYFVDPGQLIALSKRGIVAGFKKIPPKINTSPTQVFGFRTAPANKTSGVIIYPPSSYLNFCMNFMLSTDSLYLDTENGEEEYQYEVGTPILEGMFEPTQALGLLEASLLMSALTKALATRIISIEVGTLTRLEAQRKLEEIKRLFTQHISLNSNTGEAESFTNPGPAENTVFITTSDGVGAISVTTIGGDINIKDLAPLDYFKNKQLTAAAAPQEFLNYTVNEGFNSSGQSLAQKSSRYLRRIQRLQSIYTRGWEHGINQWYERNNLPGYANKFKLRMNVPASPFDLMASDKLASALDNAMKILDFPEKLGYGGPEDMIIAIQEVLSPVIPKTAGSIKAWKKLDASKSEEAPL